MIMECEWYIHDLYSISIFEHLGPIRQHFLDVSCEQLLETIDRSLIIRILTFITFKNFTRHFILCGIISDGACLYVPTLLDDSCDVSYVAQSGHEQKHDQDIDTHCDQTMELFVGQLNVKWLTTSGDCRQLYYKYSTESSYVHGSPWTGIMNLERMPSTLHVVLLRHSF